MFLDLQWVAMPLKSWAGVSRMVFPTGSVPTPGTQTGVTMVS